MKALTLTQPWASLVAADAKRYETRSWATSYRGPLAIHAAKGFGPLGGRSNFAALCFQEPFRSALIEAGYGSDGEAGPRVDFGRIPLGKIVALAELTACLPCDDALRAALAAGKLGAPFEAAFGDFSRGRYAWRLERPRLIHEPVPAKGSLGLWEVPTALRLTCEFRLAMPSYAPMPEQLGLEVPFGRGG